MTSIQRHGPELALGNRIEYRPQLDGIRFVAVLVVLIFHSFNSLQGRGLLIDFTTFISFFFVLSGYLITKTLFAAKEKGAQEGQPKKGIGLRFLARRTLRIFPAYYVYLILIMLVPVGGTYARIHSVSLFLYISNFQSYADQVWGHITLHLWTLAVEEQFYLIWPWLIIFIPNKYLPRVFMAVIAIGVLFRFISFAFFQDFANRTVHITIITPACLDSFGLGALLAYQHFFVRRSNPRLTRAFMILIPVWFLLIFSGPPLMIFTFVRLLIGVFSLFLIERTNIGFDNKLGKFLESRVPLYLGRISYGIYLYHLLARALFRSVMSRLSNTAAHQGIDLTILKNFLSNRWVDFCVDFILAVALASLSWYLLEKPLNGLRRYIRYSGKITPLPVVAETK